MTPEQEEQVRRALRAAAQADEPGPMPPEVANRLDEVLADLAGPKGHPKEHVGAPADELAARRKQRWPNVVVAAAAVAVIAAVGGAVATGGFGTLGGEGDATSAEKAASSDAGSSRADSAAPSTSPSDGALGGLAEKSAGQGALPLLHASTLSADVQALLRARRVAGGLKARTSPEAPADCARPFTGRGASLFLVRLDGRPATLVVGPARDGERQARIYSCDGAGSPLATVSVPTR